MRDRGDRAWTFREPELESENSRARAASLSFGSSSQPTSVLEQIRCCILYEYYQFQIDI